MNYRKIIINTMFIVLILLGLFLTRINKIKTCYDKNNSLVLCVFLTLKGSSD
jgi:hypothetical protein